MDPQSWKQKLRLYIAIFAAILGVSAAILWEAVTDPMSGFNEPAHGDSGFPDAPKAPACVCPEASPQYEDGEDAYSGTGGSAGGTG